MERWEFFSAKPPRPLQTLDYTLTDETGESCAFHAHDWDYVLLDHGNGVFSVRLVGQVPEGADDAFKKKAAYLLVEGILGEEFVVTHILDVYLFSQSEVDTELPRTKLINLKRHLEQLTARAARDKESK